MNTTKSIKRARWALKQADIALKEANDALKRRAVTEVDEARAYLRKAFNLPDGTPQQTDIPNGLANAARLLRQQGPRAFRVGDEIEVYNALTGLMSWVVIGVNTDKVQGYRHTLTLQNITPAIGRSFDTPDLEHPWGRNCWNLCSLRAWLDKEFTDGFTNDDRRCLLRASKKTYSFSNGEYVHTSDRVFLLSASEAGFEIDGDGIRDEGKVYPFYSCGNEARKLTTKDGKEIYWWLRSPYPWCAFYVRIILPSGALINYNAHNGNGLAATCVIG